MRSGTPRRAGFSLIEVLTVTVVISLLAALLLPVLARARERTRSAVCTGNLRQLGMAAMLYHDDTGRLPVDAASGYLMWNGSNYLLFAQMLTGPADRTDAMANLFFCPSNRVFPPTAVDTGLGNLGVPGQSTAGSYCFRGTDQGAPNRLPAGHRALAADFYYIGPLGRNHPGGINVLYADGSAGFQPLPDSWDLSAPSAWSQLDGGPVMAMW